MTCSSPRLNLDNHVDKWMYILQQCGSKQVTALLSYRGCLFFFLEKPASRITRSIAHPKNRTVHCIFNFMTAQHEHSAIQSKPAECHYNPHMSCKAPMQIQYCCDLVGLQIFFCCIIWSVKAFCWRKGCSNSERNFCSIALWGTMCCCWWLTTVCWRLFYSFKAISLPC